MKPIIAFSLLLCSCARHFTKPPVEPSASQNDNSMPQCLNIIILKTQTSQRPQSITQYVYQGNTVYYETAACCDRYNTVYNSNCNKLGSPDGGITGKGDGTLPHFFEEATG